MERPRFSSGPLLALLSAALFGASTPFTKLLLGDGIDAWLLAGLLYLGSGLGLSLVSILRRGAGNEAPLTRRDWGWMALVVLAGGVTGPVLLMVGLSSTPASSAALLLNVEGLATMGIAWLVFRENVDRRLLIGAVAILAGAVLLSWRGGPGGIGLGALAIVGACLAWGIDNNLTRKLSASDPVQIAMVKGLVAGGVNLALGLARGAHLPALPALAGAGLVGFLGYGVSLVLFVLGLRHLGSARTGAYFSSAPFIGAILAIILFGEPVTARLIVAAVLMSIGSICISQNATATNTSMNRWSTPTPMSMTRITSTRMVPTTRPAHRTPTTTRTCDWSTRIRTIRTCITATTTSRPVVSA
jgi:drug/metabolite transporter (DMT)-like permease